MARRDDTEELGLPLTEKWHNVLSEVATKATQYRKQFMSRLLGVVLLVCLALGAGWLGGRWAMQSSPPQRIMSSSPPQKGQPSSLPQRVASSVGGAALSPEKTALNPQHPLPNQEKGDSGIKTFLGIRGKALRQGA